MPSLLYWLIIAFQGNFNVALRYTERYPENGQTKISQKCEGVPEYAAHFSYVSVGNSRFTSRCFGRPFPPKVV